MSKAASTAGVADAASTAEEVLAETLSTAGEGVTEAASTAREIVAKAASTADEVVAEATSTVDEDVAEVAAVVASTVDKVGAWVESMANEAQHCFLSEFLPLSFLLFFAKDVPRENLFCPLLPMTVTPLAPALSPALTQLPLLTCPRFSLSLCLCCHHVSAVTCDAFGAAVYSAIHADAHAGFDCRFGDCLQSE